MKEIDPTKQLSDMVVFDGVSKFQLAGRLLNMYYPKFTVMCGVEHTVSLFFIDVSKISIVHQMVSADKMIYNIFGYGIYHKPHSIFKSKSQDFHKINIGLFSGNDTRMAGYFMGMQRDLWMRKFLRATISSYKFISIPTNTKFSKSVSYIHEHKSFEKCYVFLKILFPCI